MTQKPKNKQPTAVASANNRQLGAGDKLRINEEFRREYLMEFTYPDQEILDLCCIYEYLIETFDQMICTHIYKGKYLPANEYENHLIKKNAYAVRKAINEIAKRLEKQIAPSDKQLLTKMRFEQITEIAMKSKHFDDAVKKCEIVRLTMCYPPNVKKCLGDKSIKI